MKRGKAEQRLRRDLREALLRPEAGARAARIYNAVKSILHEGEVYFVLADTPEQNEDCFVILVDGRSVVSFELSRSESTALPNEVMVHSIEDYRKAIGQGPAKRELLIAIEMIREVTR